MVRLITAARVKTDKGDAYKLARLLLAQMVPEVWVLPEPVRELRALVAHRKRLISQRTQARNRLQAVLHRHNLVPPTAVPFGECHRKWWENLALNPTEKLRVKQDLILLDTLGPLIGELEDQLVQLSYSAYWHHQATYLLQLPGIGVLTGMVILSAIGDITRFPSAKKLVGYAGLGASIHASGQTPQTGGITKEGRRELRTALVEAAWAAVKHHTHWKAYFQRLSKRIGSKKAIVAVARKLLVTIWHVLTKEEVDREGNVDKLALKLVMWSRKLKPMGRQGISTAQFVRDHLDQLGLGYELEEVGWPHTAKLHLPPSRLNRFQGVVAGQSATLTAAG
jgi:transposase